MDLEQTGVGETRSNTAGEARIEVEHEEWEATLRLDEHSHTGRGDPVCAGHDRVLQRGDRRRGRGSVGNAGAAPGTVRRHRVEVREGAVRAYRRRAGRTPHACGERRRREGRGRSRPVAAHAARGQADDTVAARHPRITVVRTVRVMHRSGWSMMRIRPRTAPLRPVQCTAAN